MTERQYEVTWGMVYDASSPEEALKQALGDLAEVIHNPSVGPNLFVIRVFSNLQEEASDSCVISADLSESSNNWCSVCHLPILDGEATDASDGKPCHSHCSVDRWLEDLQG